MSSKRQEAESKLSSEQCEMFNKLIQDYESACQAHVKGGKVFRNYNILAELIQVGWRKS